jgi:hypothetical protein
LAPIEFFNAIFGVSVLAAVVYASTLKWGMAPTDVQLVKKASPPPALPTRTGQCPVEIEQMDFIRAVRHFVDTHEFQLKHSAPKLLHEHWWQIAEENSNDTAVVLVLEYSEPAQITHALTDFELRLRLQWLDGSGVSIDHHLLRHEWAISSHQKGAMIEAASPSVDMIVSYTIAELRLELLAQARGRNPAVVAVSALASSLGKQKTHEDPKPGRSIDRYIAPIVEKAYWPSPQDYNEAIQNPGHNFDSALLKIGKPELNALGVPRAASGAFASVYKLVCPPDRDYAIKCFLTLVHDSKDRYEMISSCVLGDNLDYTVDFEFLTNGILVRGKKYPILRMDWVTGEPLNSYVERHLDDPAALKELADNFVQMMVSLRGNGIAHGDLQHGNILVTSQGIRLVDYDGMFVPGMEGMVSNELGHRNYQHPERHPTHFGPWLDNFSAWVIYISLRVLAVHPELWNVGAGGDEALIFRQSDFTSPNTSPLINALISHSDTFVKRATEALVLTLQATPDQVPYLDPN